MRGLTDIEREILSAGDVYLPGPRYASAGRDLIVRGALRLDRYVPGGSSDVDITSLGRLAYACDTAARGTSEGAEQ